jgi:hypothetical protein
MLFQDVQEHNNNNDIEDRRMWIGDGEYWQIEAEHWKKLFEGFGKHLLGRGLLIPSEYRMEDQQLKIDTEWGKAIGTLNFREAYEALDLEHLERMPGVTVGSRTLYLRDHRVRISDRLLYQIAARHWEVLCKDMADTYACLKVVIDYRETIRNSFYWRTEFDSLNYVLQKLNRANSDLHSPLEGYQVSSKVNHDGYTDQTVLARNRTSRNSCTGGENRGQDVWKNRLRRSTRKPKDIVKRRQAAATKSSRQETDHLSLSSTPDESFLQTIPARVTQAKKKNITRQSSSTAEGSPQSKSASVRVMRRRSPRQAVTAKPQGVQKDGKLRYTPRLKGATLRKQKVFNLTPPESDGDLYVNA